MNEHRSSVLNKSMKSALENHKKLSHKFDFDSVKIIDSENNKKMRKVVQAIHIRNCRPSLSRQGGLQPTTHLHAVALRR